MNQDYYLSSKAHQGAGGGSHQVSKQTSSSILALPLHQDSTNSATTQQHYRQPRTTKARDNNASSGNKGAGKHHHQQQQQQQNNAAGGTKGKSQLAKDYYMMQAFVQQPHHHQMSAQSMPTVGAGMSSSAASCRPDSTSNNNNHSSGSAGGRRAATANKGHKDAAPSSTYYTTQQKVAQANHSSTLSAASSALSSKKLASEPASGKRAGAQSAHCGMVHGSSEGRTPKTPQTANIFRRKWGGASSTKSHKSQSSQRSIGQHAFNTIPSSTHHQTGQESDRIAINRSARGGADHPSGGVHHAKKKRERSRPNSSSKTPNLRHQDNSTATTTNANTNSNFKTLNPSSHNHQNQHLQKNHATTAIMETPPIYNQKATRSSSSEIRTNQIDFTALARNRMQTQSNRKQHHNNHHNQQQQYSSSQQLQASSFGVGSGITIPSPKLHQPPLPPSSPFQDHIVATTASATSQQHPTSTFHNNHHQMPPKPVSKTTPSNQGTQKTTRRKSKSKSISQQQHQAAVLTPSAGQTKGESGPSPQQIQWSTSHKNILNMKPIVERNNGGAGPGGTQLEFKQAQLTSESVHTKKKLRNLLQSVTISSGDPTLKPTDAALGQMTPSRKSSHKSDSNAKAREQQQPQHLDNNNQHTTTAKGAQVPLSNRRISGGKSGKGGKNTQARDRNQMMTPVMSQQSNTGGKQSALGVDNNNNTHQNNNHHQKQTRSHRIAAAEDASHQQSNQHQHHHNQKMTSSHTYNPLIQTGFKSRHRSASNQKHQSTNSHTQILQTHGSQMGTGAGVKEPSQTDQKKRESAKRKKSATRRVKSTKRPTAATAQAGIHQNPHAASHPQIQTNSLQHVVERGRSPNRNMTIQQSSSQHHQHHHQQHQLTTTTQNSHSQSNNQMLYSAYRLRTLKPKNNGNSGGSTSKHNHTNTYHHHGGSHSLERQEVHHVGLLNKGDSQTHQLLMQSASSGHSACSNNKVNAASAKEHKQAKTTHAQKNKMLANIQQQVVQGSKTLGAKRTRQQQEANRKQAMQTEKKMQKQAEKDSTQIKVDLMKASLIADIRIDTRLQRQSQETGAGAGSTPSDSMKSGQGAPGGKRTTNESKKAAAMIITGNSNHQNEKILIKPRSVSSDEHLVQHQQQQQSPGNEAEDGGSQINKKQNRGRKNNQNRGGDADDSPKFLLSLRQLEKLLFSTQKISSQLKKQQQLQQSQQQHQQNQGTASSGAAKPSRSRKQIIENSLKVLSQTNEATSTKDSKGIVAAKQQKKQVGSNLILIDRLDQAGSPSDKQLITIQPTSIKVFNMQTDQQRTGAGQKKLPVKNQTTGQINQMMTPTAGGPGDRSQSHTQSVAQIAILETGEKQVKLRMDGGTGYSNQGHQTAPQQAQTAMNRQLLQVTARKIQDKISKQQSNLLSLVDLQKMRAQRMATTHGRKADLSPQAISNLKTMTSNAMAKQIYRDYSSTQQLLPDSGNQASNQSPLMDEDGGCNSAMRLQNLIYQQLESRQTPQNQHMFRESTEDKKPSSKPRQNLSPDVQDTIAKKTITTPEQLEIECRSSTTLNPAGMEEDAQTATLQTGKNSCDDNHPTEEELTQNIENTNAHERSFLDKIEQTKDIKAKQLSTNTNIEENTKNAVEIDQQNNNSSSKKNALTAKEVDEKDASMCSLKQPSLRQITSSHTSRSNKLLQRQDSADQIRRSQDPNASITLSKILLETSMQQSERGPPRSNTQYQSHQSGVQYQQRAQQSLPASVLPNNNYQGSTTPQAAISAAAAHYDNQMINKFHKFQRLQSEENENGANEIMSYQSISSAKVMSEVNKEVREDCDQEKTDSDDKLRSIPRSYTNPEKFGGKAGDTSSGIGEGSAVNGQYMTSKQHQFQKTSPLHNFMADEVWPTNSSRRQRKSSITSLSNSTPGSRTLEQLQYQSHAQSLQSPSSQTQYNNNNGITGNGAVNGRSSQMLFEEQAASAPQDIYRNNAEDKNKELIERSPLQYQKEIQASLMEGQQDQQLIVQDQAEEADEGYSSVESVIEEDIHVDDEAAQGQNTPSASKRHNQEGATDFDDDQIASRGTSSPKRRRSPANPVPSPSHAHSGQKSTGCLQPIIQLDNSTSFVNDFPDDIGSSGGVDQNNNQHQNQQLSSQAYQAQTQQSVGQVVELATSQSQPAQQLQMSDCKAAATSSPEMVLLQQQQQDESSSYEDIAPYEKSQNEGLDLNLIMFQGPAPSTSGNGGLLLGDDANNNSSSAAVSNSSQRNHVGDDGPAQGQQHERNEEESEPIVNQEDINIELIDLNDNAASRGRHNSMPAMTTCLRDAAIEDTAQLIRVQPIVVGGANESNKKSAILNRQLSESTGAGKSELAAIEDVLILTPQSPTDKGQNTPQHQERGELKSTGMLLEGQKDKSSPRTEPSRQQSSTTSLQQVMKHGGDSENFNDACASLREELKKASGGIENNPDSRSSLGLNEVALGANRILGIQSEKQTPNKIIPVVDVAEAAASQSNGKLSEPTVGRKLEKEVTEDTATVLLSNENEQMIKFPAPAGTPNVQLKSSVASSSEVLDFEEAVNVETSPSIITNNGGSPTKTTPKVATTSSSGTLQPPNLAGTSILGKKSPLKPQSGSSSNQTGKLFDIDSLNEINKANDLASKKIEITNFIFEALVGEIKDNLFPLRDEEEDEPANSTYAINQGKKKKKKKKRVARSVMQKKPSVQPKIKEIKDGQPVDMCLNRIMIQASKMRRSLGATASPEMTASLSVTQSLSASKEDYCEVFQASGGSYHFATLDQTKSKEQLEASNQFHQLELRKQEQLDLMQRQLQMHEESKTTSQREDDDLKQLQNNLRGIKTSTDVVDQYLGNLFDTLLNGEQEFLDNLATPFSLNPLQELINLQVLANQARNSKETAGVQEAVGPRKMLSLRRTSSTLAASQENELEVALFGFAQQQHPVLSVEIYLDIERKKEYVLLADSLSEIEMSLEEDEGEEDSLTQQEDQDDGEKRKKPTQRKKQLVENQSMLAEWENIHNKVLFDAVNDALDEFRPYGLRGPPAPWSGQTRALTYRYSQNAKEVLQQVQDKVVSLSKTFGGALANSELLREYHIRGPLEQDKLQMLREERLAIMMMQDVEETQHKWEDLERQETGVKVELADLILEQLTKEIVDDLTSIGQRQF